MTHADTQGRLIELSASVCRQCLGSHGVGRLAFNAEPSPEVFPVNYVVRDDSIYFRTGAGAKQAAAARHQVVTFQVDKVNEDRRSGWSVMVSGRLETVDTAEFDEPPEPLPGGERPYLIRLHIDDIAGRQIPPDQGWELPTHAWTSRDASDLMG